MLQQQQLASCLRDDKCQQRADAKHFKTDCKQIILNCKQVTKTRYAYSFQTLDLQRWHAVLPVNSLLWPATLYALAHPIVRIKCMAPCCKI